MKTKIRLLIILSLISCVVFTLGFQITAQAEPAAPDYVIEWWTIDGGGGELSADGYVLQGTIGQPDAGNELTSGDYALTGGFWSKVFDQLMRIFIPLVLQ